MTERYIVESSWALNLEEDIRLFMTPKYGGYRTLKDAIVRAAEAGYDTVITVID